MEKMLKACKHPRRINVLGVGISAVTMQLAIETITCWIEEGQREYVVVCPVYSLMKALENPDLRLAYHHAGMVTPDGMPVALLAKWQSNEAIERVYGPDLMFDLHQHGLGTGFSHYYLGGAEGVAQQVANTFEVRFPGLKVAGTYTPPFRELTADEEAAMINTINEANPDVLWVALGSPRQDYWMARYRSRLNARVVIAVGAAFDFHTGRIRQAPRWMQKLALEWLFRLIVEPRRLWRRYIIYNPLFIFHVILQKSGLKKYELIV